MRVSTQDPAARAFRRTRTIAASFIAVGLWWSGAATSQAAGAGGSSGAGGDPVSAEASLRTQAQELADQIQAEGVQLDQLSAAYEATDLRSQQLAGRLQVLQARIVRTDGQVNVARTNLKEQALLSYVAGGAPVISQVPGRPGLDKTLTVSYAEIVSGGQQRAVNAYRAVLAVQTTESEQLKVAHQQSVVALSELQGDRVAAEQTLAAREQTLGQVRGQLATLVAQVQAAQARAEQASVERSLAQQGELPAANPTRGTSAGQTTAAADGTAGSVRPANSSSTGGQSGPTTAAPAAERVRGSGAASGSGSVAAAVAVPTTRPAPPATAAALAVQAAPTPAPPPPTQAATTVTTSPPPPPRPTRATPPPTQPAPPPTRPAPPPTAPPTTAPAPRPPAINSPAPGAARAVAYAYAQIGKPYQWAGAGPNSFDCSGLTMMAWEAAGVYLPHLAQAQYDLTMRIPLADALPGDLIFYGTPNDVFHVGIYIGGGEMIAAPETGQNVGITSIYWSPLLGAGRVV